VLDCPGLIWCARLAHDLFCMHVWPFNYEHSLICLIEYALEVYIAMNTLIFIETLQRLTGFNSLKLVVFSK
jgi:hypothetical protein